MLDASGLQVTLQSQGIQVNGSIIKDTGTGDAFFVFVEVTRDQDNRQIPSNRKLTEAKRELADQGTIVEFLLSDPATRDIEGGLRATLLHAFGAEVRNAFMSIDDGVAFVWLEPKRNLDESVRADIDAKIKVYLSEFGFRLGSTSVTTNENLPSMLACLRVIRQMAPVASLALKDALTRGGFTVPSIDWLNRRLDSFRRAGKITRLDNGLYVLALKSLRELGTVKGRGSPDIARLLAMARRRL
jgi:hypothetical protein